MQSALRVPITTLFTLETERLLLRELSTADAPFILRLLNEPSFLHFIGDKGVRNLDDARSYILTGPVDSYERHGFGLYCVQLKNTGTPIGICGLLKRESLADVDIGFAFLPEFWNKGYAFESGASILLYGKDVLKLPRIVAITNKDNNASAKLLDKLGLHFDRLITMPGETHEIRLFTTKDYNHET